MKNITLFNDWVNEQKIDNIELNKLNKLTQIITEKYPSINYGGCAVFARAFHTVTNLPYMLIIDTGLPEEDPPIHVMIELPNGKLLDGEGITTKTKLKEYYRYDLEGKIMFLKDPDGSLVDIYYDEYGNGFTIDHKEYYDDILNIIKNIMK
jgi:hypothetical protein